MYEFEFRIPEGARKEYFELVTFKCGEGNKKKCKFKFTDSTCCGVIELRSFMFYSDEEPTNFKEEFIKALREVGKRGKKAIVHLTLTQQQGWGEDWQEVQPDWFIKAVHEFPNSVHMDWKVNPNTKNKIQMWLLPLEEPEKESIAAASY